MPPSVVLEVVKVLTAEVDLREQTRGLQQSKSGVSGNEYSALSARLANVQDELGIRLSVVLETINSLPEGPALFKREIHNLSKALLAMADAKQLLADSETGAPAIAAETEAIELLLKAKREKKDGGGGSASGSSKQSALAKINVLGKAGSAPSSEIAGSKSTPVLATGRAGQELPEEFRLGLDRFFERLEGDE